MDNKKIKIDQDINDSLRVRLSGCLPVIAVLTVLWGVMVLTSVDQRLNESNKIQKHQLDQAKKQYQLDSMRHKLDSLKYYAPFHTR
jgi:hypothetical protein